MIPHGKAQIFFHFAWFGVSGPSRSDVSVQLENALMAEECVHVAKGLGCWRFVYPGSIVERGVASTLYSPQGRPDPMWPYGGAKIAARAITMKAASCAGIDACWCTVPNVYGPGDLSSRLVSETIRKVLLGEAPEFTDGWQNYDFVYVDDAARGFRLIGERGLPFHDYFIGSGHARPVRAFLLEMQEAIAPGARFRFGALPYAGQNIPLSCFDCGQTEHDTDFRAEIGFPEGCRRTKEWLEKEMRVEKTPV